MPPTIGVALSSGLCTMGELATTLGLEELHDVLEVVRVNAHNDKLIDEWRRKQEAKR